MRRAVLGLMVWAVPLVTWAADSGGAKAGIDAGNRKFEAALAKGDAAALAKLYATDAEILPPGGPMVKSREAIEKFYGGMLAQGFKKIVLTTHEVHAVGTMAAEVNSWRIEDATGKALEGKGVVLWKKTGSTWQLYRDIWNDNGQPEPPKAEKTAPAAK